MYREILMSSVGGCRAQRFSAHPSHNNALHGERELKISLPLSIVGTTFKDSLDIVKRWLHSLGFSFCNSIRLF